jgi:tight adherence protein C
MTTFIEENLLQIVIIGLLAGLLGIILIVVGLQRFSKTQNAVSQRMQDFVENKEKKSSTGLKFRLLPRELSGSFFNRTIKPAFENIIEFFGRFTPSKTVEKSEFLLTIAGNPSGMHAQQFYGVQVLFMVVGIVFAVLINYSSRFANPWMMLLGILIILVSLMIPRLWLNSKVKDRKDELRRNLPDALDMLSVCATAGLGFDQSMKKITEYWTTPLSLEFRHVLQDMDIGVSRGEALHNMSVRLDVTEISSFVAIIIQAETIGMSFSEVLHSQAKQMRILRQFRAKEIANSMPAKMIVPVVLFIFPALLAVIIAPIIPTLFDLF